jgi:hypothetical protein
MHSLMHSRSSRNCGQPLRIYAVKAESAAAAFPHMQVGQHTVPGGAHLARRKETSVVSYQALVLHSYLAKFISYGANGVTSQESEAPAACTRLSRLPLAPARACDAWVGCPWIPALCIFLASLSQPVRNHLFAKLAWLDQPKQDIQSR